MFKQGIVGLSLALLTATPVLAQMGAPPANTGNTGGTQAPANGEQPKTPAGAIPTSCPSAAAPQSTTCTAPAGAAGDMQATQPPRDLLHENAA